MSEFPEKDDPQVVPVSPEYPLIDYNSLLLLLMMVHVEVDGVVLLS